MTKKRVITDSNGRGGRSWRVDAWGDIRCPAILPPTSVCEYRGNEGDIFTGLKSGTNTAGYMWHIEDEW